MSRKSFISFFVLALFLPLFSNLAPTSAGKADEDVAAWVKERVKSLQPTSEEKRFDEIGWAKSIVEAEKLARQHDRPVFLFTHNGSIGTGRC
jgi:hypothetical protein